MLSSLYQLRIDSMESSTDRMKQALTCCGLAVPTLNHTGELKLKSVSYTHLDVYKRQGRTLPMSNRLNSDLGAVDARQSIGGVDHVDGMHGGHAG